MVAIRSFKLKPLSMLPWSRDQFNYLNTIVCYMSNSDNKLLSLMMVSGTFKFSLVSMQQHKRHLLNPRIWPSVQVTKLPTTFFYVP